MSLLGALCYLAVGVWAYRRGPTDDLLRRWREAGYVAAGFDPIRVLWDGAPVLPGFGAPSDRSGYPPWSYVLGQVFAPPQLSYRLVRIWYFVANALTFAGMVWLLATAAMRLGTPGLGWRLAAAGICCSALALTLNHGQYGLIVTGALLGFIWAEEHRLHFVAGLCLAVACVKPQTGALFVLLAAVRLSPAAIHCLLALGIATGVASLQCQTSPWDLSAEMLVTGMANEFYLGIAEPLRGLAGDQVLLGTSVVLSTVLALLLLIRFRRLGLDTLAAIPAVLSTVWMSHRTHDLMVVSLLVVPLLATAYRAGSRLLGGVAIAVAMSHWLPHLNRFYSHWPVPLSYRLLWLGGLACLLVHSERLSSSVASHTGVEAGSPAG